MRIGIEDRVAISPAGWPTECRVRPGDFSLFAPIGLGIAPPAAFMPWDTLRPASSLGSFYGAFERTGDPYADAPVNDGPGGIVYFRSPVDTAGLEATMTFMGVRAGTTGYAAYARESDDVERDRYLAQIRIVCFEAMKLFGARPDPGDVLRPQALDAACAILAFVDAQEKRWSLESLEGSLGGDGDWAHERLAFGLMVENASSGVYRVWSRPWLVTK